MTTTIAHSHNACPVSPRMSSEEEISDNESAVKVDIANAHLDDIVAILTAEVHFLEGQVSALQHVVVEMEAGLQLLTTRNGTTPQSSGPDQQRKSGPK